MNDSPAASPLRRIAVVILPFVVVGAVVWVLLALGNRQVGSASAAAVTPAGPAVPGATAPDFASVAQGLLGSSVMRGLIASSQRKAIDQEIGGILAELKFTGDQRERFVDLLLEEQSVVMEGSLLRMTGKLGTEEDAQLQRRIDAANEGALRKSEEFFTKEFPGEPGKFAAFQHHMALAPDRVEVAALQQRLAAAKRSLTPAQERALAEVLHEVRLSVVPALELDDPELPGLSTLDLARRIRDQQRIDTLLRTRTATVLDAAQVAVLAEQQTERLKPFQAIVDQASETAAPAAK
jgi:hypothetical protein